MYDQRLSQGILKGLHAILARYSSIHGPLKPNSGFTIVELLIVIVIIGILAAIVIVAYNGIQTTATENSVKTDLQANLKVMRLAAVGSTYPVPAPSLGLKFNKTYYATGGSNLVYCRNTSNTEAALAVALTSGKKFVASTVNGVTEMTTGWNGTNACAWGNVSGGGFYYGYATATGWADWTN